MSSVPISSTSHIDASRFGDPVAMKTKWGPIYPCRAIATSSLVEKGICCCTNNRNLIWVQFGLALVFCGIGLLILLFWSGKLLPVFALGVCGWIFTGGGLYLFGLDRSVTFDKEFGYFWTGRRPKSFSCKTGTKTIVPLADIHALQLLRAYIKEFDAPDYSYEMSLVCKDGTRVLVLSSSTRKLLHTGASCAFPRF